jgi:hypothetical protein
MEGCRFPCHAVTVRRDAVIRAGLFDEQFRSCEDWDLWLRLAALGYRFCHVPGARVGYRQSPTSMSTNYERMYQAGLAVVRKNRRLHGRCAPCDRAVRAFTTGQLRSFHFAKGFCGELAGYWFNHEYSRLVRTVLSVGLRYPFVFPLLAQQYQLYSPGKWARLAATLFRSFFRRVSPAHE